MLVINIVIAVFFPSSSNQDLAQPESVTDSDQRKRMVPKYPSYPKRLGFSRYSPFLRNL